ncbi:hypothetical protein FRB91_009934 [Serendipita sp. 411]|nr:hypothetical protein FRB91_009934 [Serendipita sp. 411]
MLHTFTLRICKDQQQAKPKDIFQKILARTKDMVGEITIVEDPTAGKHTMASSSTPMTADEEKVERRKQTIKELKSFHSEFVTAKEADSYSPWVNMTNTALSLLRNEMMDGVREYDKEINLILQHNDSNLLYYKHNSQESSRKPDSIFVTTSTACALHGAPQQAEWTDGEWTNFAKQYATKRPNSSQKPADEAISLDWGDALSSVQYKRHKPQVVSLLQTSMSDGEPKTFYTVLQSEHLWGMGKRRRDGDDDETENENITKSMKRKTGDKPRMSASLTGPSHSQQKAANGANVSRSSGSPITDLTNSVAIQSAEYALNRLCCSFDITHTLTFILIDTTLYISWYDHEGIITTEGFDVAKYLSYYLALLFILQRFNRSDWGRCGHSNFMTTPQGKQENPSLSHEVKIKDKTFLVNLTEAGLVHKGWALSGRSSCLRTCKMKGANGWSAEKYVIKFGWKEKTLTSEGDIMRQIQQKAANDPKILDFIPRFIEDDVFSDISTDGHRRLWELGIQHRDISAGNLLYWKDEKGHVYGTLADFDLSSLSGERSNNKQRTGTLPFMAVDLLHASRSIIHKYEHDVESFFWVLVYVVLCGAGGNLDCPMRDWGNLGIDSLRQEKKDFLTGLWKNDEFQPVSKSGEIDFERFHFIRSRVPAHFVVEVALDLGLEIPDANKFYDTVEIRSQEALKTHPLKTTRPEVPPTRF